MEGPNILVVDDDPKMLDNLKELLDEEGYNVSTIQDPVGALEAVKKNGFSIALVDLIMPEVNGIDLLKGIRSSSPNTKVIIITGFATIESAVEAMKAGASDYVTKPFKINEIQNVIKKTLEEIRFEEKMLPELRTTGSEGIIKAISNPIRRGVISLLWSRKRMRFTDIKKTLGVDDPTKLSFHLRELKESGLLSQNPQKLYMLTAVGNKTARLLADLEWVTY